jgi:hypothetical protein
MPEVLELSETLENDKINAALLFGLYPNANLSANPFVRSQLFASPASDRDLIAYMNAMEVHRKSGEFQDKLLAMGSLKDNWDTYGAEAPSAESLYNAVDLLVRMEQMSFLPSDVLASSEGGVALSFKSETRYADIELLNSGEVLAVIAEGSHQPHVWEVEKSSIGFDEAITSIYVHFSA